MSSIGVITNGSTATRRFPVWSGRWFSPSIPNIAGNWSWFLAADWVGRVPARQGRAFAAREEEMMIGRSGVEIQGEVMAWVVRTNHAPLSPPSADANSESDNWPPLPAVIGHATRRAISTSIHAIEPAMRSIGPSASSPVPFAMSPALALIPD